MGDFEPGPERGFAKRGAGKAAARKLRAIIYWTLQLRDGGIEYNDRREPAMTVTEIGGSLTKTRGLEEIADLKQQPRQGHLR